MKIVPEHLLLTLHHYYLSLYGRSSGDVIRSKFHNFWSWFRDCTSTLFTHLYSLCLSPVLSWTTGYWHPSLPFPPRSLRSLRNEPIDPFTVTFSKSDPYILFLDLPLLLPFKSNFLSFESFSVPISLSLQFLFFYDLIHFYSLYELSFDLTPNLKTSI